MNIPEYSYLQHRYEKQGISALKEIIENCSAGSIIIWDLDYTLLGPNDRSFNLAVVSKYRTTFFQAISRLSNGERNEFLNFLCYKINTIPVQPKNIQRIFSSIHNRKIHTLGLSSMTHRNFCDIKRPHETRIDILGKSGIQFTSDTSKSLSTGVLYKGAVFSDSVMNEGKAEALRSYLLDHGLNDSKKIIYIDDNPDNFKELSKYLGQSFEIKFLEFLATFSPNDLTVTGSEFENCIHNWVEMFKSTYSGHRSG